MAFLPSALRFHQLSSHFAAQFIQGVRALQQSHLPLDVCGATS